MWLKRRTPQNIVIGGAAGAFPPMIGWAAVTGGIDLTSISLFGIIFLWTPPHFWALALVRSADYEAAKVPMLPVVAGDASTRRWIVAYSLLLLPMSLAPCATGAAGAVYGIGALVAGSRVCGRRVPRPGGPQPGCGEAPLRHLDHLSLCALRAPPRRPCMAGPARAMRDGIVKDRDSERRRKVRNLVLGGALLALAILFYLITIVRMGGE